MKTKMAITLIIIGTILTAVGVFLLKPKKPVYSKEYGCIGLTVEQCAKMSISQRQANHGYQKSWEEFHNDQFRKFLEGLQKENNLKPK